MSNEINVVSTMAPPKSVNPQQASASQTQQAQSDMVQMPRVEIDKEAVAKINQDTVESIKQAVAAINDFMGQFQRSLNFSVDDRGGQTIIKVMDKSNDTLIRQIPSEDFIKLTEHVAEMQSLLFSEKA